MSSHPQHLVDVVVLACGPCNDMMPLAESETVKAMLPICNRPMIWYCLFPWVEAGYTTFYICVDDVLNMDTYLRQAFGKEITFHFVVVSDGDNRQLITTSDAVRSFLLYKDQRRDQLAATHREELRGTHLGAATFSDDLAMELEPKDAILLHSDTILSRVDVESFIKNFYVSLSSVTMMLAKPIDSTTSQYAIGLRKNKEAAAKKPTKEAKKPKKEGGNKKTTESEAVPKGKHGQEAKDQARSFVYQYSCVVYEEEEEKLRSLNRRMHYLRNPEADPCELPYGDITSPTTELTIPKGVKTSGMRTPLSANSVHRAVDTFTVGELEESPVTTFFPETVKDVYPPHHHRIHVTSHLADLPLYVTLPFAARRPHLHFERGVVDVNLYLVRHWVLQYIAEKYAKNKPLADSIEEGAIPALARAQHTVIDQSNKSFSKPDNRLEYSIPPHWLFIGHGRARIETLNASSNGFLPERADPLRVSAVIYEEHPDSLRRIYRVNNVNNYMAANEEIIRCRETFSTAAAASPADGRDVQQMPFRSDSCPFREQALSLMLPDSNLTLLSHEGSQKLYIKNSFLKSHVPPHAYITRSVIGLNAKIHPRARITDSIILDSVEVEEGAEVKKSVLGYGSVAKADTALENRIICSAAAGGTETFSLLHGGE